MEMPNREEGWTVSASAADAGRMTRWKCGWALNIKRKYLPAIGDEEMLLETDVREMLLEALSIDVRWRDVVGDGCERDATRVTEH